MLAYEGNADVLLVSAALDALQKTKAQYPKARLAITTADMGIVLLAQAPGATKNVILRLFSHRSATVHVTCQQAYLLAAWTGLEAVRKTNLGALVIRIGFGGTVYMPQQVHAIECQSDLPGISTHLHSILSKAPTT